MKAFQQGLRILGTLAAIGYIVFLAGLIQSFVTEGISLANILLKTEVWLFLIFVIGFYWLWKSEFYAGLIFIIWHIFQWMLVLWVWEDGAMTLVMGFPIALTGILLVIFGILNRSRTNAAT